MITKNHKLLWSVIILLTGLNIWLIYGKFNMQQELSMLQTQVIQKGDRISALTEPVRFIGGSSGQPLQMVAVFTDHGCQSCIVAEIKHLNKWSKRFDQGLQVFYLGTSNEYLENSGAQFDYKPAESVSNLFNVEIPVGNPFTTIIDENNMVQAIHVNDLTRPGSERKRALFYKRAESLFRSVYEK